jgi:protein-tyrosine phosphatase
MSKFRTIENMIRDVVSGKAPLGNHKGMRTAIREVAMHNAPMPKVPEPTNDAFAKKEEDTPSQQAAKYIDKLTPDDKESTHAKVLDKTSPEHQAYKEYVKRAHRKLKIIDNP